MLKLYLEEENFKIMITDNWWAEPVLLYSRLAFKPVTQCKFMLPLEGLDPVVQSIVSLTSSLKVGP